MRKKNLLRWKKLPLPNRPQIRILRLKTENLPAFQLSVVDSSHRAWGCGGDDLENIFESCPMEVASVDRMKFSSAG